MDKVYFESLERLIMKKLISICFVAAMFGSTHATAAEFKISFQWLESSRCTGGYPDTEKNPKFVLENVPEGTAVIKFIMDDQDAPGYYHGGGSVKFSGQSTVESGAFKYKGPCPPGVHTYVWTATAKDANGKTLGRAKAKRNFPE